MVSKNKLWKIITEPKEMDKKLALRIKDLRVKRSLSWRGVTYHISNKQTHNQLLGMWLCEIAMKILRERKKDGWN